MRFTEMLSMRVTKKELRNLKRIARENRWTMSQLLRFAIEEGAYLVDQRQWQVAEKVEVKFRCGFCRTEVDRVPDDWSWVNIPYEAEIQHKVTGKRRSNNGTRSSLCCPSCRAAREFAVVPQVVVGGTFKNFRAYVNGVEVPINTGTTTTAA